MKIIVLSSLVLLAVASVLAQDDPPTFSQYLQSIADRENNAISTSENAGNGVSISHGGSGLLSGNEKSGYNLNVEHYRNSGRRRHQHDHRVHDHSRRESRKNSHDHRRHDKHGGSKRHGSSAPYGSSNLGNPKISAENAQNCEEGDLCFIPGL